MQNDNQEEKLPLDAVLQYHILKMLSTSDRFANKALYYLEERYFENSILGWFYKTIREFYDKFKKPPELHTLKNEILKFPQADRSKYDRAYERIETSKYPDEDYLLQELTGWLRRREFILLHKEMAELYNKRQHDSAYDVTSEAILRLKGIDLTKDTTVDFFKIEDAIERASKSSENRIPIGIPEIDRALLGGLPRQTLTTVLGSTNSGKSIQLINMAYNAILANKKVLHVYHEGADDQMALRFLSRFTGIPYMCFFNGLKSMTEQEMDAIATAKRIMSERLILKPWQEFGLCVEDVISYFRQLKSDFDYDMVVDDYAQLLFTRHHQDEIRHNQANVYRALNQTAAQLNVAVVTAAQGNRMSHKDAEAGGRLIGLTDIAECFEICRVSECVLTLTRSNEDQVNNRVKILLAKQRDGAVNVAVDCNTDLHRLIMYDRKLGIKSLRLNEDREVMTEKEEAQSELQLANV